MAGLVPAVNIFYEIRNFLLLEIPVQDSSSEITTLTKVHVSNVGPEISDDRLSDLFSAVGGTKRCVVHHTASGKSLGLFELINFGCSL